MDKPITILFPAPAPNTYIALVEQCIKESGFEIVYFNDAIRDTDILNKAVVVNLNWYEGIKNQKLPKYLYITLRKIKDYLILKKYNIKIIFTFHNILPHDTAHKYIDSFLIKFCLNNADKIVGLCNGSKDVLKMYLSDKKIHNKVRIINHLPFTNIYKDLVKNDEILKEIKSQKTNKEFHCLFFGLLREYKNIEMILQLAEELKEESVHFVIAGKASDNEYKEKLINKCNSLNNISIIPRFITDEEVIALFDWSDVFICPLNLKTSINSGSMILSFGFQRPVIGPRNGTMKDFPLEDNYSYEYTDEREHYKELKSAFSAAYNEWENSPESLLNKGEKLFEYLESNYSYEITQKKYKDLYSELFEWGGAELIDDIKCSQLLLCY